MLIRAFLLIALIWGTSFVMHPGVKAVFLTTAVYRAQGGAEAALLEVRSHFPGP